MSIPYDLLDLSWINQNIPFAKTFKSIKCNVFSHFLYNIQAYSILFWFQKKYYCPRALKVLPKIIGMISCWSLMYVVWFWIVIFFLGIWGLPESSRQIFHRITINRRKIYCWLRKILLWFMFSCNLIIVVIDFAFIVYF